MKGHKISGGRHQEFVLRLTWKWASKDVLEIYYGNCTDRHDDFPIRPEYARSSAALLLRMERRPNIGATEQTRVTCTRLARGDAGPRPATAFSASYQLVSVERMRKCFDRSSDVLLAERQALVAKLRAHRGTSVAESYTDEENDAISTGIDTLTDFEALDSKEIKMPSRMARGKAVIMRDSKLWGWSSTVVRAP